MKKWLMRPEKEMCNHTKGPHRYVRSMFQYITALLPIPPV